MPRRFDRVRKPLDTKTALERSKRYQVRRIGAFVDQFPQIHGTVPEKMVYAALSRLGIEFYFLNDIRLVVPEIEFDRFYQADFIIPSAKIIIEVQGAHWHSTPQAIEADSFKFALYQLNGWKPVAFWDYDIMYRLDELILSVPELKAAITNPTQFYSRELTPMRRTKIDSSQGIRTLNQKKRKPYKKLIRYKGQTKGLSRYNVK